MTRIPTPIARHALVAVLPAVLATAVGGCLGEPPIEERLTRLEILSATPTDADAFAVGGSTEVRMRVRITYRELLTGHVVAELRASETLTAADTDFERGERWVEKSEDVDEVLDQSVSLGFEAFPSTGWPHLVQEMDLAFDAGAPVRDASGVAPPVGAPTGLFLVLYYSTDVEEVELRSGERFEVVTPLFHRDHPILYEGVDLVPGGGAS